MWAIKNTSGQDMKQGKLASIFDMIMTMIWLRKLMLSDAGQEDIHD